MQKTFIGTIPSLGLDRKALSLGLTIKPWNAINIIVSGLSFLSLLAFSGGKEGYTLQHPNVKLAQEG